MKIFGWMQNKKTNAAASSSADDDMKQEAVKEEFSDWLLTIGTFDLAAIRNEETETDQELRKLVLSSKKQEIPPPVAAAAADLLLPLDRFLNCPSSLEVDRDLRVILAGRCNKKAIGKKSLISFLFKKIFLAVCGADPLPLPEPRMEKLQRAMLKNKINNPHQLIEDRRKLTEGSKWVKTDSEYIILEI